MKINGIDSSLGLLLGKIFKIVGIKFGFIWPTLRAKILFRLYGCKYGKSLKVCGKLHLRPSAKNSILLGDNVKLTSRFLTNTVGITNPMVFECVENGCIEIGSNSGLTSTIISARCRVIIGSHVKVGANVRIFDHDFHSLDFEQRRDGKSDASNTRSAEIVIEDDVFIGTNSIILKGVHVGRGSIISAGSVVAIKNIPPLSRVVGNPAYILSDVKLPYHAN
jgi:acetyltransferase-like isoleucine patch superfamily enzyme